MKNIGQGSIKIDFESSDNSSEFIVLREFLEVVGGLDTVGVYSEKPIIIDNLNEGESYFLSVVAKNSLGNSEPTEMLGIVPSNNDVNVLIVNGFDRISGTNNTFDYIRQHGSAFNNHGQAFDAASNEAVVSQQIDILDYQFVDWILGEEGTSTSVFSYSEQNLITTYLESGRFLFVSGSEIGYDLEDQGSTSDKDFYQNYLKADYISDAAGGHEGVYSGYGYSGSIFEGINIINYDDGGHGTYNVDWPDGIKPIGGASFCAGFSGVDQNSSGGMGIQYIGSFGLSNLTGGLIYLSVGFETIYPEDKRNEIMSKIIASYESQLKIEDPNSIQPKTVNIKNIYPNPSNSSITISFSVLSPNTTVDLSIKNILGQEVYKTSIKPVSINEKWTWNGIQQNGFIAPSGNYFISISQSNKISTRKITLLK